MPLAGVFAIAGALVASSYGIVPNALTVDLPAPYPDNGPGPLSPHVNRLIVTTSGAILWNGAQVSEEELGRILERPNLGGENAPLLFAPEADASYARAIQVLDLVRKHGAIDRCFRFSEIERYRRYEDPDSFAELAPPSREDCAPLPSAHSMPSTRP